MDFNQNEVDSIPIIRSIAFYLIMFSLIALAFKTCRSGVCTPGLDIPLFFLGFLISIISFIRSLVLTVTRGKQYLPTLLIHTTGVISFYLFMD